MSFHKDVETHRAFISLIDALCSWERETGRGSTLLFVPDANDERILLIVDGKPVSHTPFELGLDLDIIKNRIMPDKTEKRYRCTDCGNIFYAEDPPVTIPTSVVFCPSCDGLAEIYDVEIRIKAEKLDAIEVLMREQPYIDMNRMNQYSVKPFLDHRGTKLVESIMAILFPDDPDEPEIS